MIGLILLVCIVVYLALYIGIIVLVGKWAKKRGRRRWLWCPAAGLFMYLLVAWDQIPTYVVGKYYCETQAGLVIYKTPDQWLSENPWAIRGGLRVGSSPSLRVEEYSTDYALNNIFIWSVNYHPLEHFPVTISTEKVLDRKTGDVLVKHVSVGTGYYRWQGYKGIKEYKLWVGGEKCGSEYERFIDFRQDFRRIMEDK